MALAWRRNKSIAIDSLSFRDISEDKLKTQLTQISLILWVVERKCSFETTSKCHILNAIVTNLHS